VFGEQQPFIAKVLQQLVK